MYICKKNNMYTIENLKEKTEQIHHGYYDYDWSTYTKYTNKMKIICPEHGEFYQSLHEHIGKKHKCPKCSLKNKRKTEYKIIRSKRLNSNEFLKKCNEKFDNKYTYDLSNYKNLASKIIILCPKHGKYTQTASTHLKSNIGCPKCSFEHLSEKQTKTTIQFIQEAKQVHGNKYDYSKVDYTNCYNKVCVICPEHGEFWQAPSEHLAGFGCNKCGVERSSAICRKSTEKFIEESNLIHKNKYFYNKVLYINNRSKVCITCPKHGDFMQSPFKHLSGQGCPKCSSIISKGQLKIFGFCEEYLGKDNVILCNRTQIKPYELDIYIPSKKFAIEYNGLRWYTEKSNKDKNYHLKKLNLCKEQGIKLLQIFEDEFVNMEEIVYNKIKHIISFNEDLPKIPGRKCIIKEIDKKLSEEFLNKYHIQGFVGSTVHLGAYFNDKLIGVMCFKQEQRDYNNWELTRFVSDYHFICQGVGGKLFKYFVKNYNPEEVKSFADRRWTVDEENNIYVQLGFKFDKYTPPEYRYYKESDGCVRQHKFNFRKNRLNKKFGVDLNLTEREMTEQLGYNRIYDCGLIKYVWKKETMMSSK